MSVRSPLGVSSLGFCQRSRRLTSDRSLLTGKSSWLADTNSHPRGCFVWLITILPRSPGIENGLQLAQTLLGAPETERLTQLARLLDETAILCRDFGTEFVSSPGRVDVSRSLHERRAQLDSEARSIPPPFGAGPFSGEPDSWLHGDLSSIITNICDRALPRLQDPSQWKSLSSWIDDTVLSTDIGHAKALEWRLIGRDTAPGAVSDIERTMDDLSAVLRELVADPNSARAIVSEARKGIRKTALARAADAARSMTQVRVDKRRHEMEAELRSAVANVEVYWLDDDQGEGSAPNFAVSVPVDSLIDWPLRVETLVGSIEAVREPSESPLIVPILKGWSIWRYAFELVQQPWPVIDPGEFEDVLPRALVERLTAHVVKCHSALQALSALYVLAVDGEIDARLMPTVDGARRDFEDASKSILESGNDAVIVEIGTWLLDLCGQVNDEWDGKIESGRYAANVWPGILGDGSVEVEALDGALALALEWDAEPAGAVRLLEAQE